VLSFDFIPTTNQVAFQYAFASDEYPEWVNTVFNDVFAFWVTDANGQQTNCATVRQTAGDPNAPQVPVAINNINDSNPVQSPAPTSMRPDLFRPNYVGSSTIDLESDGITKVLTCQAAVTSGAVNHMRLAIADSSDGIYDSNVFIKASSLVSNAKPVADLGLDITQQGSAASSSPATVQASVEGHDPNGAPLSYSIAWGDGSTSGPSSLSGETSLASHTYAYAGEYAATLTVSNGSMAGTSCDDVKLAGPADPSGVPAKESCDVSGTGVATGTPAGGGQGGGGSPGGGNQGGGGSPGGGSSWPTPPSGSWGPGVDRHPASATVPEGSSFSLTAAANAKPYPSVQWQVSSDGGETYDDIPGATAATKGAEQVTTSTYTAKASAAIDGLRYRAVFSNDYGQDATDPAIISLGPPAVTVATTQAEPSVGQAVTLAVNVPSGKSGKVVIKDGPKTVTSFAVTAGQGSKSIKWTAPGGKLLTAEFTPKGSSQVQSSPLAVLLVTPASTTISITPPAKSVVKKSVLLKLKVTAQGGAKPSFAGGTYSLSIDGVIVAPSLAASSTGAASFTWVPQSTGSHLIEASWNGTSTSLGSSSSRSVIVVAK